MIIKENLYDARKLHLTRFSSYSYHGYLDKERDMSKKRQLLFCTHFSYTKFIIKNALFFSS